MRRRLSLTPPLFGRRRSERVFPQFVVEHCSTFSRGLLPPLGGGKGEGTKDDDSKNWKPSASSAPSSSPSTSLFRGRFRPKLSTTTTTTTTTTTKRRAFLSSFTSFPSFAASGASSIINEKNNDNNEKRVIETYRKETDEKKKTKKKTKKKKIPPDERRFNEGVSIRAEEILEKRRLERQRTPLSEARELHVLATTTNRKKTKKKKETMTMNHQDYTPQIEREAKLLGVSPHLIRGRRYYAALPPGSKKVIPREVWDICERLSGRGFKAYIVGGAVRDLLQGAKPRDFDVMTDAKYQDIQHVFGWKRVRVVGRRFKVAHVRTFKPTHGRPYVEVSSCTEGDEKSEEDAETDGGGGNDDDDDSDDDDIDPSWQSSQRMYLRKDARKRDFTVNGMAYELLRNLLHDYVDGYEDLRDNIVRSIGKPHVAFKDDPARILRAIRVSAKRNMEPTKEVRATMRAYAPLLNELNRERKMLETRACLARGYSKIGMKMLWMSSTLDVLMPTVARFIKERGGRKRTMLEFQKTGFEHVLDAKSWDEEKEDFRTIFMNKDDVADDVSKKRVPSGVTAGGLFKLLENFDKYVGKDVKLTEEGVSAEFLIATLATPIALYYSGLKTVPQYSTRKRQVEVPTKKKSSRGGGGGTGGKKTKTVTEVNPAWLRWTAACERVLRELSEVDGLMLSSGRRSNNQGGRTYQIMTKSFMNSSSSSSSSSSASIESDDDEEKDDDFEDEDLIDYEDELGGKKYEESQASLVKIVYETFGVPETEFDEDSFKVFVDDDDK